MTELIRRLRHIEETLELAIEADREGHRFVSRLLADWRDGSNRFDAPGEALFVAIRLGQVVGVCGLNIDPYVADSAVGRVRHLYVVPSFRRARIGSSLVGKLITTAAGSFRVLRVRTNKPATGRFYEALGFARVEGDEKCTHQLMAPVV